jgi:hypothetical protein
MPNVKSTCYPERPANSFNEWQQDLYFERELERCLENLRFNLREELRKSYYERKSIDNLTLIQEGLISKNIAEIFRRF